MAVTAGSLGFQASFSQFFGSCRHNKKELQTKAFHVKPAIATAIYAGVIVLLSSSKTQKNMTRFKLSFGLPLLLFSFLLALASCSKSGVNESASTLQVYLTDGPGEYDAVNIDIQKVEVKVDTNCTHKNDDNFGRNDADSDDHLQRKDDYGYWVDLNVTPGVVDVLALRNGIEQKLGEAGISSGTVRKVRITLGTANTVVKAGVSYPLTLANPANNYLYVSLFDKHRERANASTVKVWLDFDIARSIVEVNGQFLLKPVIRPFCNANFGTIAGAVLPTAAKAVVRVSDGAGFDAVALPNSNGNFKLRGLPDGTYTVTFEGLAPYQSQTKTGVVVKKGETTQLEPVTLQP
jgi:hypothetical protein